MHTLLASGFSVTHTWGVGVCPPVFWGESDISVASLAVTEALTDLDTTAAFSAARLQAQTRKMPSLSHSRRLSVFFAMKLSALEMTPVIVSLIWMLSVS